MAICSAQFHLRIAIVARDSIRFPGRRSRPMNTESLQHRKSSETDEIANREQYSVAIQVPRFACRSLVRRVTRDLRQRASSYYEPARSWSLVQRHSFFESRPK